MKKVVAGMSNASGQGRLLNICLVSPVPPPNGGMGRWTMLIRGWIARHGSIGLYQIDISPRWRDVDDLAIMKRIFGGGLQLARDYFKFLFTALTGVDLIHLTTSGRLATVRDLTINLTALCLKIPVVYHLHFGRVPEIARSNSLEWLFLKWAMVLAGNVLALDRTTANTIKQLLPRVRVEVIPNPIDIESFPLPEIKDRGEKIALFVGWVIPTKGIRELLEAWKALDLNGWSLEIAGPGSASYQARHLETIMPSKVNFLGELSHDEVLKRIATCDLFVLPSHTEAFPYVVLEAMAMSRPVLATSVGAIPEILSGSCGEVVPPRDVAALTTALLRLASHESLRLEYGARAREKVMREYELDTVMRSILGFWSDLAPSIIDPAGPSKM